MSVNTPVNPSYAASEIQSLSGTKEFFLKKALATDGTTEQTLVAGDLLPMDNIADAIGYPGASLANVTDVEMAGGNVLKVPGNAVSYADLTLELYLPPSNAKLQEMEDALYREDENSATPPNKNAVFKWNLFALDAYGWGGLCFISSIDPVDDNGFHYRVTLSIYNVFRIRPA